MIIIIDFGSQTCHLIGRRIRDLGIPIQIINPENALNTIKKLKPSGIIFSGGPSSVYEKGAPSIDLQILELKIPILGICYGWQLIAHLLHGNIKPDKKEYGPAKLHILDNNPLLQNVKDNSIIWLSHGDSVINLPPGFKTFAQTENIGNTVAIHIQKKIYGIQFHPEVEHTIFGTQILKNFVINICQLKEKQQTIDIALLIKEIKEKVGDKKVICGVSGGIDSTVAAILIGRAIGKNLYPVYIESGLMRSQTKENVNKIFKENLNIKPIIVNAKSLFLNKLKGVTNPEKKRKIIGNLYVRLFEKKARTIKNISYLAQGTIYSDVIESKGTKNSSKIKSHHNVGGLPKNMKLKLLEPLRYFYKDEVRLIGKKLGLSSDIIQIQVFPGPGQAIRIIGEVTKIRLAQLQKADQIVLEEIKKSGLYDKIHMSFPVMTNTKSTSVKGDGRSFLEVIALRIIESKDIMTSDWSKIPYEILQKISSRIVNEVPSVSRVVYDITTKPPATMEWE